ncbi:MAG: hypothetical protein OEQ13_02550 [Acidobacteriota bacterium]|nr:hypothetical protein [Acidobacteriota bacterium]
MTERTTRRTFLWLAAGLALAIAVAPSLAQKRKRRTTRPLQPPVATDEGSFAGTWSRVEGKLRMALQLRKASRRSGWELRYMWMIDRDQLLDTAWQTLTEFEYRGYPGSLRIEIDRKRSDDARIVASWKREQHGPRGSLLTETGALVLYRTGERGERLFWQQDEVTRRATVEEPLLPEEAEGAEVTTKIQQLFVRQSVRLLHWDEIYW